MNFIESKSISTLLEDIKDISLQKCRFCLEKGDKTFFICGHDFCSTCLNSTVKRCCLKGEPIVCDCNTPISYIDIKSSFSAYEDLNETIFSAVFYDLVNNPNLSFVPCPVDNCSHLREKVLGYSQCDECKVFSCPLCRSQNENEHLGVSCSDFRNKSEFEVIFKKAKKFLEDNWNILELGNYSKVERNPGLELGCPAMQKFAAAVRKIGSRNFHSGFFAWHGTPDEMGVIGISHDGFDPKRRTGQAYGSGEYFGQDAIISHGYSKSSGRMFVCYILRVPEVSTKGNYCYVVKNPTDSSLAYNLPVLVVTYGRNALNPVDFIKQTKVDINFLEIEQPVLEDSVQRNANVKAFRWHWQTDEGSLKPYMDQVNTLLETKYEEFRHRKGESKFKTPPIVRFIDDKPQEYYIDFINNNQINCKTSYTRKIERKNTEMLINKKSKWTYLADDGRYQDFDTLVTNKIEEAFQNYVLKKGSAYLENLNLPGRPEKYTINFIQMKQINEWNRTSRTIKRNEI